MHGYIQDSLFGERNSTTSLSGFVEKVVEFTKKQRIGEKIWYRGHGSANYRLIPNLYREILDHQPLGPGLVLRPKKINLLERGIDASFSRQANGFLRSKGIQDTKMNRYFLKQHYKIKTRLLDWTESALAALFFALTDTTCESEDAVVYMLLPLKLNSYAVTSLAKDPSKNAYIIFYPDKEFVKDGPTFNDKGELRTDHLMYKYYTLEADQDELLYPIAIYPPYLDERMSAQQSCFTLFGNVIQGLQPETTKEEFLFSIHIQAAYKKTMLSELRILGFSEFSVYPDMDGLGHSINNEYSERFNQERAEDSHAVFFNFFADRSGTEEKGNTKKNENIEDN